MHRFKFLYRPSNERGTYVINVLSQEVDQNRSKRIASRGRWLNAIVDGVVEVSMIVPGALFCDSREIANKAGGSTLSEIP